ncbi:glycerol-3-phosphate dehydrogenase/oxidase [Paraflavitalea sp. CAU 1676]|uniref:glycerol-3-phosphate dehydrogenase/oxidase n=1 Tax=Paraflavitalea sp. CAU 1676 TaxID=3032598 RepID=UPI0023DC0E44|nr:glycerol-3-phosphate dehydrogenase/oxidase [Paraflavitalea sp. CAU 1676]MDF2193152.1 glycerol-3-phosphate dehydrogenase/oxidase [Paraflavitalea sp. CAU 1676]
MNRQQLIDQLESNKTPWDIIIIGGGATGLGAAVDAAARGYRTILFEGVDFAKGTSSRSTKLVHGGVRYLQQGNIKLVMDALKERGIMKQNAPHLVKNQSFIVPNYKWWEGPYYGLGLKVYDWMSGSLGLGTSEWLSTEEVLALAPTLDAEGLRGGVLYHDGQFDDARLAINLAQTAVEQKGVVLNYFKVTGLLKSQDKIAGVIVKDELTGKTYEVQAKVVINATGVFSDAIQQMDDPEKPVSIAPSQGIHVVLDKEFLPGEAAIMIPHTDDGRVLFAVPWHQKIIVGTTDTAVDRIDEEPRAQEEEIQFILEHAARYLTKDPTRDDVKSIFAGLRPLVKSTAKKTAEISRDHSILISDSGLVSILGGKWTTYRKMAADVINIAAVQGSLPYKEPVTKDLPIHGAMHTTDYSTTDYYYGSDKSGLQQMIADKPELGALLHPRLPYQEATIIWAVQHELCMTLEDALSRRTRALLLDAKAAIEAAPRVAQLMAGALKQGDDWIQRELEAFHKIARQYLPG